MTESVTLNDKGVYKTPPTTWGLLISLIKRKVNTPQTAAHADNYRLSKQYQTVWTAADRHVSFRLENKCIQSVSQAI